MEDLARTGVSKGSSPIGLATGRPRPGGRRVDLDVVLDRARADRWPHAGDAPEGREARGDRSPPRPSVAWWRVVPDARRRAWGHGRTRHRSAHRRGLGGPTRGLIQSLRRTWCGRSRRLAPGAEGRPPG